jgi:hypothetical protein
MKRRPWDMASALLAGVVCLAVGAAPGWAKPTSHEEAAAAGNPAATAPSFRDDAHGATFRDEPVTESAIRAQDLACLAVRQGPSRCYETALDLEAGERRRTAVTARKARRTARASRCGIYEILHIWVSADYTGSGASLADRRRWANIGNGMNNRGSSFVMGDHSGHLAEEYDGVGYWYPRNTGVCAYENNLNTNGSGWNNRISSRYRN